MSTAISAAMTAVAEAAPPGCRFCGTPLRTTFVDLGSSPLCQTLVRPAELSAMERFYPLHVRVCERCFLVQLPAFVAPQEIFGEYAYFSSYASTWVEHARRYAAMMIERFRLGPKSRVMEVASNDGYLLQHFVAAGVPALGIEPAANVAKAAVERGVPTLVQFLGEATGRAIAADYGKADVVAGNNVLAHVPDLNDFVIGMRELLAADGVITMEFPHLVRLIEGNQFDTIYHEHFSYFTFTTVEQIFAAHRLVIFDVEELPTHGGSLRIYARHVRSKKHAIGSRVDEMRRSEKAQGYRSLEGYVDFGERVRETKRRLLEFLIDAKRQGKRIAGYGAPGKSATLLNYCGIRTDFLDFTVDANPYKQGKYTPGTRIPILAPQAILDARPDLVLILPWNLEAEIVEQMSAIREWGGRFVVPIPSVRIVEP